MMLSALIATAAIGTMSGSAYYLMAKEDRNRFKKAIKQFMDENYFDIKYFPLEKTYQLKTLNYHAEVSIKETNDMISCTLTLPILKQNIPAYVFEYDKNIQQVYNEAEDLLFVPYKKSKDLIALIEEFQHFVITGGWKEKIPQTDEVKIINQNEMVQEEKSRDQETTITDTDILFLLENISQKMQWLKQTSMLEIEEQHTIEVLSEDAQNIVKAYETFRPETQLAFKEKVLAGLSDIQSKLNELSIKKEERIASQIDKTISLIKKR